MRWLAVSAALLLIFFGLALLQFGFPSLSRVEAWHQRYELAGYWDAAGAPSGLLEHPFGIAVAPSGEVYVTDSRARVIRFSSTGVVLGEWGGEGAGAGQFTDPVGVAVGADGAVFVSDYDQDRIQQFTADGRFISAFGRPDGAPGQLNAPAGLAVDSQGSIYVADFYNHRIDEFRRDGSFARIIGHPGRLGGGALHYPTGVAVLPNGGLLVADAYNYRLQWFDRADETSVPIGAASEHGLRSRAVVRSPSVLVKLFTQPKSSFASPDRMSGLDLGRLEANGTGRQDGGYHSSPRPIF